MVCNSSDEMEFRIFHKLLDSQTSDTCPPPAPMLLTQRHPGENRGMERSYFPGFRLSPQGRKLVILRTVKILAFAAGASNRDSFGVRLFLSRLETAPAGSSVGRDLIRLEYKQPKNGKLVLRSEKIKKIRFGCSVVLSNPGCQNRKSRLCMGHRV